LEMVSKLSPGALSVISGFLFYNLNGILYLWGGISTYITSYLRQFDPELSLHDSAILLPIGLLVQTCCFPISHYVTRTYGVKAAMIAAWSCFSFAPLLGSFATSFWTFVLGYNILFSIGIGLSFLAISMSAWCYYPQKKGLVTGLMMSGFGTGPFVANFIAQALVNPNNEEATEKEGDLSYFGPDVYENVPRMLRVFSVIYFCIGLTGLVILKVPDTLKTESQLAADAAQEQTSSSNVVFPNAIEETKVEEEGCTSVREAAQTGVFWRLALCALFGLCLPFYIIDVYKMIGSQYYHDDAFLTVVGSFGVLANGTSRVIWGQLLDSCGFIKSWLIVLSIQVVVGIMMIVGAQIRALYVIAVIIGCACDGGQFTLVASEIAKVFGTKMSIIVYACIVCGFTSGTLFGLTLNKFVQPSIGYDGMFTIFILMSVISALIIALGYNSKIDWTEIKRKELESYKKLP